MEQIGNPYVILNALLCGWAGLRIFGPLGALICAVTGAVAHIALKRLLLGSKP